MKWIISLLAFVLLAISVSSFTTNVFISDLFSTFDSAKENALQQNDAIVNESVSLFYSSMNASQREQLDQIANMDVGMKQIVLVQACVNAKDQPFCNSDFINGRITFDAALRDNINVQIDNATSSAMDLFKEKFEKYQKTNFILIGIITGILSLMIYFIVKGKLGVKIFFGNASWLGLLSAISFKIMPGLMNGVVTAVQTGKTIEEQKVMEVMSNIVISWINSSMHRAFIVSMIIFASAGLVWLVLKLFTEYSVVRE